VGNCRSILDDEYGLLPNANGQGMLIVVTLSPLLTFRIPVKSFKAKLYERTHQWRVGNPQSKSSHADYSRKILESLVSID
jgi:hypothetical protein